MNIGDYERTEEWLLCSIFRDWFHSDCFYDELMNELDTSKNFHVPDIF